MLWLISAFADDGLERGEEFAAVVRWLNRLLRYAGVVLAAYWGTIFVLSHLPRSNIYPPLPWHRMDKVLHLGGYAALAFLCAAVWTRRRSLTGRQYCLILLGLACYAAFDELTQAIPGINRNCDPLDWLADTIGAVVGLSCFAGLAWTAKRILGWRLVRNGQAALQTTVACAGGLSIVAAQEPLKHIGKSSGNL